MTWDRAAFWRQPEVEALMREHFAKGTRAAEVAKLLNKHHNPPGNGQTRNSVIGRWHRMGLTRGLSKSQAAKLSRGGRPPKRSSGPAYMERRVLGDVVRGLPSNAGPMVRVKDHPEDIARVASILDLEDHHCRFPVRKDGFCGDQKVSGLPYCEAHVRRCYRVPEKTAKRTKRLNKVLEVLGSETTRKPLETVGN
ncbi:MAG: GcrA family cell cycle regulator [Pseudomonadota bacterium]